MAANAWCVRSLSLALLSTAMLAAQSKRESPVSDLVGSWQGSMESDGPSVEVQIREDQGQLHGKMIMPLTSPGGSQSKAEEEILQPEFDGRALSFKIKANGQLQAYRLELVKQNAGELRPAASGEQGIQMTRISSQ